MPPQQWSRFAAGFDLAWPALGVGVKRVLRMAQRDKTGPSKAHPVGEPSPAGRGAPAGLPSAEPRVDRRKSVWAPGDTQRLFELMHTAIVVGTAIAVMWALLDLFNVA